MNKVVAILKLVRWPNLLFMAIILWMMEKQVAVPVLDAQYYPEQLPWYIFVLIIAAVLLIAAGGYAINDYFDVKIDAINRPEHQVVTVSLTKQEAMLIHQITTIAGVICGLVVAILLRSWMLAIVFVFTPGLLWFYSSSYKRQFIVGNVIVSLVSALTPFVIAMANVAYMRKAYSIIMDYSPVPHDLYLWIGIFAVFAFFGTWIREIEKDLQDMNGDRELECHTMPIQIGETWTKIIVTALVVLLCCLVTMVNIPWRYVICGILIPFAGNVVLLWSAKISSDYQRVQILTKIILFIGLCLSFLVRNLLVAENFLRV